MFYLYSLLGGTSSNGITMLLNEGWTVSINETTYKDVDLRTFKFNMPQRGDVLHFYRNLPEEEVDSPLLKFFATHGTLEILVGGDLLYRYGYDYYAKGQSLGYGDHLIPLPDDYIFLHVSNNQE